MFNLLVELGARLDIKNRQGLTPLTLAAKLTRKEVLSKPLQAMVAYSLLIAVMLLVCCYRYMHD